MPMKIKLGYALVFFLLTCALQYYHNTGTTLLLTCTHTARFDVLKKKHDAAVVVGVVVAPQRLRFGGRTRSSRFIFFIFTFFMFSNIWDTD